MTPDRFQRHLVRTNGVELSYLEAGDGPVVILAHGFPETSHSWRHQMTYLADHGYRALALDLRGYGGSSKPHDVASYSIMHLSGDLVALAECLEIDNACVVGHDWGAPVAWHCALFRPDLFVGVVGLSVPYRAQRAHAAPTSIMSASLGGPEDESFYMVYFQEPGLAEAEFELDVERTIRCFLYGVTPSVGRSGWQRLVTLDGRLLTNVQPAPSPPPWLTEEDIAHYVRAFSEGGFRGPLNLYRNLDTNWELTRAFNNTPISVPALYLVGEHDMTRRFSQRAESELRVSCADLRGFHVIRDAGHWLQQEKPAAVNELLLEFLNTLTAEGRLLRSN